MEKKNTTESKPSFFFKPWDFLVDTSQLPRRSRLQGRLQLVLHLPQGVDTLHVHLCGRVGTKLVGKTSDLWWVNGGIYGGIDGGIYGGFMGLNGSYPLVNMYMTMENHMVVYMVV